MNTNSEQKAKLQKAIAVVTEAAKAQPQRVDYLSEDGTWRRVRFPRDMEVNLKVRLHNALNEFEGFRSASPSELKSSIVAISKALKMASKGLKACRSGLKAANQELTAAEAQHIDGTLPPAYRPLAGLLEQIEKMLGDEHLVDLGEDLFVGEAEPTLEGLLDRIASGCDESVQGFPKHQGRSMPLTHEGRLPHEILVRNLWWAWYENAGVPELRSGSPFENWISAALELLPARGMRALSLESLKAKTRISSIGLLKKVHAECLTHLQNMARNEHMLTTSELELKGVSPERGTVDELSASLSCIYPLSRRARLQELYRVLRATPSRKPGRPKIV